MSLMHVEVNDDSATSWRSRTACVEEESRKKCEGIMMSGRGRYLWLSLQESFYRAIKNSEWSRESKGKRVHLLRAGAAVVVAAVVVVVVVVVTIMTRVFRMIIGWMILPGLRQQLEQPQPPPPPPPFPPILGMGIGMKRLWQENKRHSRVIRISMRKLFILLIIYIFNWNQLILFIKYNCFWQLLFFRVSQQIIKEKTLN